MLPLGGLAIVFLYKICGVSHKLGTNNVIKAARAEENIPPVLAPLIFISTVITHLFGGSAGREGAALQLGGGLASAFSKLFRLDGKDTALITKCGMSAVFSALFGTPITAVFFVLEVLSVGIMEYSALFPTLIASLCAYKISLFFGVKPVRYTLGFIPETDFENILKVIVLGILCAIMSIVFCLIMKNIHKLYSKYLKNLYIRAFVGGITIILLTFAVSSTNYNGAGTDIIGKAVKGSARPEAFALKLLFTALTIGAGFKGGEIVPTFFVGSTFGCIIGPLLGIDAGFSAALGLIGLFCGVVNCPVSSLLLSVELFGSDGLLFFAVITGICYIFSGYFGLYSSQKIIFSKLKVENINIYAK